MEPGLPLPTEILSATGAMLQARSNPLGPEGEVEVTRVQSLEGETPESDSTISSSFDRLSAVSATNVFKLNMQARVGVQRMSSWLVPIVVCNHKLSH